MPRKVYGLNNEGNVHKDGDYFVTLRATDKGVHGEEIDTVSYYVGMKCMEGSELFSDMNADTDPLDESPKEIEVDGVKITLLDVEIPIIGLSTSHLHVVLEFLEMHMNNPFDMPANVPIPNPKTTPKEEYIQPSSYLKFTESPELVLYLAEASVYLTSPALMNLMLIATAYQVKDKTVSELMIIYEVEVVQDAAVAEDVDDLAEEVEGGVAQQDAVAVVQAKYDPVCRLTPLGLTIEQERLLCERNRWIFDPLTTPT